MDEPYDEYDPPDAPSLEEQMDDAGLEPAERADVRRSRATRRRASWRLVAAARARHRGDGS